MNRPSNPASLALAATLALLAACPGGGDPAPAPLAVLEVTPPSGSLLAADEPVVIVFNKSMAPATLALGGSLASAGDGGAWSRASLADDTLTIRPASGSWTTGSYDLTVDAASSGGEPLGTLALAYEVDAEPPTVEGVEPIELSLLAATTPIRIALSEPLDLGALQLTGDLASQLLLPPTWTPAGDGTAAGTLELFPAAQWTGSGLCTLGIQGSDLAGNPLPLRTFEFEVDSAAPVLLSVSAPDGSRLGSATTLTLTFDQPVDPAAVLVTGTLLGGEAPIVGVDGAVVTVSPGGTWAIGVALTLVVEVADPAGNPTTVRLAYDVGVLFVHVNGNDSGADGTTAKPFRNVSRAVQYAKDRGWTVTRVNVTGGTFNVLSTGTIYQRISLASEGASIYGGYSPTDWGVRNPALYPTRIISTKPYSPDPGTVTFAVEVVLGEHVIDGVTLEGNAGTSTCALRVWDRGTARVTDSVLKGGGTDLTGTGGNSAAACVLGGAALEIRGSVLTGAVQSSAGASLDAAAVSCTGQFDVAARLTIADSTLRGFLAAFSGSAHGDATAIVTDNCIASITRVKAYSGLVSPSGGTGRAVYAKHITAPDMDPPVVSVTDSLLVADPAPRSIGADVMRGRLSLRNATVVVGNEPTTSQQNFGVQLWQAAAGTEIVNDIVVCSGDALDHGIVEIEPPVAVTVTHDDVFGCAEAYTLPLSIGADNLSIDPALDAAWRPTAASPTSVTQGGLFPGEGVTDLDGAPRTDPVSIGAYERD